MSRHMGLGSPGGDTKRLTATAPPKGSAWFFELLSGSLCRQPEMKRWLVYGDPA
jgi:hypothetical protein